MPADSSDAYAFLAVLHADERWESGWSLSEVVRDYQLLRLVVPAEQQDRLAVARRPRQVDGELVRDRAVEARGHVQAADGDAVLAVQRLEELHRRPDQAVQQIDRRLAVALDGVLDHVAGGARGADAGSGP